MVSRHVWFCVTNYIDIIDSGEILGLDNDGDNDGDNIADTNIGTLSLPLLFHVNGKPC